MTIANHANVSPDVSGPATDAAGAFSIIDRSSPLRRDTEAAIGCGFGDHFGACVSGFMPQLARFDAGGRGAVIGFRSAADEPLYLEQYLDAGVDAVIRRITRTLVDRRQIVEVGQLIADDRAVIGPLFRALVPFLQERGYRWICFTATHKIRRLLERAGLTGLIIAPATEEAVRTSGDLWGSYYCNDPMVMIGDLRDPVGNWCARLQNHGRILTAIEHR